MSYASLAAPLPALTINPQTVAAARRAIRTGTRVVGFIAQSLAAAATLWLLLAGPGALDDRTSTVPTPPIVVAG